MSISSYPQTFVPSQPQQQGAWERAWEKATQLQNKITSNEFFSRGCGFAATISLIALSIIFSPSSAIGVGFTLVNFTIIQLPILALLGQFGVINTDENSNKDEYAKALEETNPFLTTTIAPAVEEGLFRGVLQPLISLGAHYTLPAITLELFGGIQVKLATVVAILAASIIFGAVHIENDHAGAYYQAGFATITGIGYGVLANQYGLLTSTVAHMAQNTIALGLGELGNYFYASNPENP